MIFFFEHLHQRETIINSHQFILIDMLQFALLLSCDYYTIRIVHKCKRERTSQRIRINMKGGFPNRRVQLHLIQSLFSTLKGKVLTRLSPAGWRWHHLERTLVSPYAKDCEYQFKGLHQVLIDAQPTQ